MNLYKKVFGELSKHHLYVFLVQLGCIAASLLITMAFFTNRYFYSDDWIMLLTMFFIGMISVLQTFYAMANVSGVRREIVFKSYGKLAFLKLQQMHIILVGAGVVFVNLFNFGLMGHYSSYGTLKLFLASIFTNFSTIVITFAGCLALYAALVTLVLYALDRFKNTQKRYTSKSAAFVSVVSIMVRFLLVGMIFFFGSIAMLDSGYFFYFGMYLVPNVSFTPFVIASIAIYGLFLVDYYDYYLKEVIL